MLWLDKPSHHVHGKETLCWCLEKQGNTADGFNSDLDEYDIEVS